MVKIALSLVITVLVSALFGLLSSHFWLTFCLAFVLQFVIFYFVNGIYENYLIQKVEQLKTERIKELSKNFGVLECPCDEKNKQDVELFFDRDVKYKCSKCSKTLKAEIIAKTVLTTEPL